MTETRPRAEMAAQVIPKPGADRQDGVEGEEGGDGPEAFRRWSHEEAQAWRSKNPPLSPWRVVAAQAAAGLMCGAFVWAITQRGEAAWSALYSTKSYPFDPPASGKIAVKVINHYGDEVLKVYAL